MECPARYIMAGEGCRHFLFPPDIWQLLGTAAMCLSNALATLAGIGGGSISLVFLMFFFEYLPKDATLVVFCAILGASLGNVSNLLSKAYNGKPLIQYHLVFVSIPIMFTGSFLGVLLNKFLPSFVVCLIIVLVFGSSIGKAYRRFQAEHAKETSQNLVNLQSDEEIIKETAINPWHNENNRFIFKNILVAAALLLGLSLLRGSSKFPSLIGVQPCSATFWALLVLSVCAVGLYGWRNLQILRAWYHNPPQLLSEIIGGAASSKIEEHLGEVVQKSLCAGVLSGFGLGGGIFLVSMYRNIGCSPLQATASSAFSIFITSFLNCLQGITIGVIQVREFLYFVIILGIGGYLISKAISSELRRRNRLSYVEGILVVLSLFAVINIPIALYRKYAMSGFDSSVIFGFGSFC